MTPPHSGHVIPNILSVPGEIRNLIYLEILGSMTTITGDKTLGKLSALEWGGSHRDAVTITQVCRQLRIESLSILRSLPTALVIKDKLCGLDIRSFLGRLPQSYRSNVQQLVFEAGHCCNLNLDLKSLPSLRSIHQDCCQLTQYTFTRKYEDVSNNEITGHCEIDLEMARNADEMVWRQRPGLKLTASICFETDVAEKGMFQAYAIVGIKCNSDLAALIDMIGFGESCEDAGRREKGARDCGG